MLHMNHRSFLLGTMQSDECPCCWLPLSQSDRAERRADPRCQSCSRRLKCTTTGQCKRRRAPCSRAAASSSSSTWSVRYEVRDKRGKRLRQGQCARSFPFPWPRHVVLRRGIDITFDVSTQALTFTVNAGRSYDQPSSGLSYLQSSSSITYLAAFSPRLDWDEAAGEKPAFIPVETMMTTMNKPPPDPPRLITSPKRKRVHVPPPPKQRPRTIMDIITEEVVLQSEEEDGDDERPAKRARFEDMMLAPSEIDAIFSLVTVGGDE